MTDVMTTPTAPASAPVSSPPAAGARAEGAAAAAGNGRPASGRVDARAALRGGIVASVTASVAFAALFGVPSTLSGLDAFATTAWRVLAALPFLAVILTMLRQWTAMRTIFRRIRRHPALALVLVADAALFGLQIFLFAWGPLTGNALSVSLGYFLMPLVVVALGVIVLREKLSRMRGVAVVLAAVGVAIALAAGASISWATFAVALGYPAYFMLRGRFRLDSPAALALEFMILVPVSLVLVLQPAAIGALVASPANWAGISLLGLLTAVGFSAFTLAQRGLPMTLFGLLSYLEPVLLVVVSILLLGEPVGAADALSYSAIAAAIVVLSLDGLPGRIRNRYLTHRHRVARKKVRRRARTAQARVRDLTGPIGTVPAAGAPGEGRRRRP